MVGTKLGTPDWRGELSVLEGHRAGDKPRSAAGFFFIFHSDILRIRSQLTGYPTSMIGLCQEGKGSPDALGRSAGVNL